jgi:ADP-heptose:LPS heptosyltransferase
MNGAHIGDIIIATSVLPILRSAYPDAEIGFVVGSWAEMVVGNHPEVAHTHVVDHWRLNRGGVSLLGKVLQFRRTRRVALKEIRQIKYDVAISIYPRFFPDFLDLSCEANIPVRIGFKENLFSNLATALVDVPESPFVHMGSVLAEPLHALGIDPTHFRFRKSSLAPSDPVSIREVCSVFQVPNLVGLTYRVIHMGTAAIQRELPLSFWREVAEKLSREHVLLFTGRGAHEYDNICKVTEGLSHCFNACDRLTWRGFVAAVQCAEVLYGVESMAGHVAGAVGTRCIVVYAGVGGVAQWRPEGKDSVAFTNHLPCAPCRLPLGQCYLQQGSLRNGQQTHGTALPCTQGINPLDLVRLG